MVQIKINTELEIPLHLQIETEIKKHIREQCCRPGDFLFTEVGLSREAGISRDSVRQGVNRLVNDGLLERRRAKGVFVASGGVAVRRNRRQLTFVVPDIQHSFYGAMVAEMVLTMMTHSEFNIDNAQYWQFCNEHWGMNFSYAAVKQLEGKYLVQNRVTAKSTRALSSSIFW